MSDERLPRDDDRFVPWLPMLRSFTAEIDLTRKPRPKVLVRQVSRRRLRISFVRPWLDVLLKRIAQLKPAHPIDRKPRTFTRWFVCD